jgi:hypothetical protein
VLIEETPETTPEMPPLPPPPVAEKLASLRARYALAGQQRLQLQEQRQQIEAQLAQVERAMGPLLGAIMVLEELSE